MNERFIGIYGSVELEMCHRYNFYFKARSSNFMTHAATKCVRKYCSFKKNCHYLTFFLFLLNLLFVLKTLK